MSLKIGADSDIRIVQVLYDVQKRKRQDSA
jgi:hypothetical protein